MTHSDLADHIGIVVSLCHEQIGRFPVIEYLKEMTAADHLTVRRRIGKFA